MVIRWLLHARDVDAIKSCQLQRLVVEMAYMLGVPKLLFSFLKILTKIRVAVVASLHEK